MSLLPSLPDFKEISERLEQRQGEIAAKLEVIIGLLDRLVETVSVGELLDRLDYPLFTVVDGDGSSGPPRGAREPRP